jgi:SAM-dependent methyltransferase
MVDIRELNRNAWDTQVANKNRWTIPVSPEEIDAARRGKWQVVLTPSRPVPQTWFPELPGARILCLASGGGQQGPILAAAGARVVVLDNSPKQLAQDRMVAEREGLDLETIEGDMADLGVLEDDSFDLVFHPVSNCFVPDLRPVWAECYRVLRRSGELIVGFTNPLRFLFSDPPEKGSGPLRVVHAIPYSDLELLDDEQREKFIARGEPFEFGHTLADQIGGQIEAGFVLTGCYEDSYPPGEDELSRFIPSFIATRASKGDR